MRKMKCLLAAVTMLAASLACFGCGKKDETTSYKEIDSMTREEVASLAAADDRLAGDLENKTIKWLSDWDINASGQTGKSTPIDLAVFQERYGGEIEWYQCTFDERYDQLANYINSDEGIDFFYAGNFDAFPKGAIRGMFVPCDEYIDFDSELWADVKKANDSITWDGSHYMAVVQVTGDNCAVIYNRDTIQELGFDDPAELLEDDEWTWDAFEEMLEAFVDVDNGKYGIDGWWFESGLSATCGVPYIGMEEGRLVSNLSDPAIERVQNFMYDLYNKNAIAIGVGDFGWSSKDYLIGEGGTLFYPCGLWCLYGEADGVQSKWKSTFGENCMFVPMPRDPDADEYYIPTNMDSYVFIKGGQNPEGVARYLDCKRLTLINEDIRKIGDETFIADYAWSDEMIAMKNKMDEMALENPVIDFKTGVTADLFSIMDSSENGVRAASRGTPWNESLAAIKEPVETMIEEANNGKS